MRYVYHKEPKGNFGDDLNGWLWPQFFGAENFDDGINFYGIGTILNNDIDLLNVHKGKKIFFGTGFRPRYNKCSPDEDWNIKFLRGPLSAYQLGQKDNFISDAAYCLRLVNNFKDYSSLRKKHEVSIIPHVGSIDVIDWELVCSKLNYNFISPRTDKGLDFVLEEIASSKFIIAEAMHGAIIADIFRIPWKRFVLSTPFFESSMVSEYKWLDWILSIKIPDIHTQYFGFQRSTSIGKKLLKLSNNRIDIKFIQKSKIEKWLIAHPSWTDNFNLSADTVIKEIDEKIEEKVHILQKEYHAIPS